MVYQIHKIIIKNEKAQKEKMIETIKNKIADLNKQLESKDNTINEMSKKNEALDQEKEKLFLQYQKKIEEYLKVLLMKILLVKIILLLKKAMLQKKSEKVDICI